MKKLLGFLLFVLIPAGLFALTTSEMQVVETVQGVHTFLVVIGVGICIIGMVVGAIKMGASGDENGKKLLIGAIIAAFLILLSKPLFNIILDQTKKGNVQNTEVEQMFQ